MSKKAKRGPVYRSSEQYPDDRHVLVSFLRAHPEVAFRPTALKSETGVPKDYVRRALTEEDDKTGISGVTVDKDADGFSFRWTGQS